MQKNPCPTCSKLIGLEEIVDSSFPPEINNLQKVGPDYSDEELLKCPQCHKYFLHCTWTPGGSEDAMRTYTHESLDTIDLLHVHIRLLEKYQTLKKYAEENQALWGESFSQFAQNREYELKYLKEHAEEAVENAIAMIQDRRSEKVHPYYREEVRKKEENAATLLIEYLGLIPYPARNLTDRICQLLNLENINIRNTLIRGLRQNSIPIPDNLINHEDRKKSKRK